MTPLDADNRHPKYKHLIIAEFERHYSARIVRILGCPGSALISNLEDFDDEFISEHEFGYVTDEYLDILT